MEFTLAILSTDYLNRTKHIHKSTFPYTLTPEMAKNHETSVYFSTNSIITFCHAPPYLQNSKCDSFQTKDAIELERSKKV